MLLRRLLHQVARCHPYARVELLSFQASRALFVRAEMATSGKRRRSSPAVGDAVTMARGPSPLILPAMLSERSRLQSSVASPAARGFDMSRFRLRHIALHFAYLGHDYLGFAAQNTMDAAGAAPATVELALFAALQQACLIESSDSCGYTRCGRTDRGVSAGGQIVSLRVRSLARRAPVQPGEPGFDSFSSSALTRPDQGSAANPSTDADNEPATPLWVRAADPPAAAGALDVTPPTPLHNGGEPFPAPHAELDYAATLNSLLPPDIRVFGWADVGDDFSARFSCTSRVYRYHFPRRDLDVQGWLGYVVPICSAAHTPSPSPSTRNSYARGRASLCRDARFSKHMPNRHCERAALRPRDYLCAHRSSSAALLCCSLCSACLRRRASI